MFPIALPPLRDARRRRAAARGAFLAELNERDGTRKRFSDASTRSASRHRWPGNVRELRNAVERAFIMADSELELAPTILPRLDSSMTDESTGQTVILPLGSRLDEAERSLIEATLEHFDGNKRRAAEVLGCSLKTLYNKLNRYARETTWVQAHS